MCGSTPRALQLAFGKLKGTVLGGLYDVKVEREADGSFTSVSLGAEWTGERTDDEALMARITVEHRLAEQAISLAAAIKKAKAEGDAFDASIAPLRELYRAKRNRSHADRAAFVAMVLEALL